MKINRINPINHITPTSKEIIKANTQVLTLSGNTTIDLGEIVKNTTKTKEFEYVLTNKLGKPVIISNIKPQCDACTTVTNFPLTDKTISGVACKILQENESITIKVSFDVTKSFNPVFKTINYTIASLEDYNKFIKKEIPAEQYKRKNEFRRQLTFTAILI